MQLSSRRDRLIAPCNAYASSLSPFSPLQLQLLVPALDRLVASRRELASRLIRNVADAGSTVPRLHGVKTAAAAEDVRVAAWQAYLDDQEAAHRSAVQDIDTACATAAAEAREATAALFATRRNEVHREVTAVVADGCAAAADRLRDATLAMEAEQEAAFAAGMAAAEADVADARARGDTLATRLNVLKARCADVRELARLKAAVRRAWATMPTERVLASFGVSVEEEEVTREEDEAAFDDAESGDGSRGGQSRVPERSPRSSRDRSSGAFADATSVVEGRRLYGATYRQRRAASRTSRADGTPTSVARFRGSTVPSPVPAAKAITLLLVDSSAPVTRSTPQQPPHGTPRLGALVARRCIDAFLAAAVAAPAYDEDYVRLLTEADRVGKRISGLLSAGAPVPHELTLRNVVQRILQRAADDAATAAREAGAMPSIGSPTAAGKTRTDSSQASAAAAAASSLAEMGVPPWVAAALGLTRRGEASAEPFGRTAHQPVEDPLAVLRSSIPNRVSPLPASPSTQPERRSPSPSPSRTNLPRRADTDVSPLWAAAPARRVDDPSANKSPSPSRLTSVRGGSPLRRTSPSASPKASSRGRSTEPALRPSVSTLLQANAASVLLGGAMPQLPSPPPRPSLRASARSVASSTTSSLRAPLLERVVEGGTEGVATADNDARRRHAPGASISFSWADGVTVESLLPGAPLPPLPEDFEVRYVISAPKATPWLNVEATAPPAVVEAVAASAPAHDAGPAPALSSSVGATESGAGGRKTDVIAPKSTVPAVPASVAAATTSVPEDETHVSQQPLRADVPPTSAEPPPNSTPASAEPPTAVVLSSPMPVTTESVAPEPESQSVSAAPRVPMSRSSSFRSGGPGVTGSASALRPKGATQSTSSRWGGATTRPSPMPTQAGAGSVAQSPRAKETSASASTSTADEVAAALTVDAPTTAPSTEGTAPTAEVSANTDTTSAQSTAAAPMVSSASLAAGEEALPSAVASETVTSADAPHGTDATSDSAGKVTTEPSTASPSTTPRATPTSTAPNSWRGRVTTSGGASASSVLSTAAKGTASPAPAWLKQRTGSVPAASTASVPKVSSPAGVTLRKVGGVATTPNNTAPPSTSTQPAWAKRTLRTAGDDKVAEGGAVASRSGASTERTADVDKSGSRRNSDSEKLLMETQAGAAPQADAVAATHVDAAAPLLEPEAASTAGTSDVLNVGTDAERPLPTGGDTSSTADVPHRDITLSAGARQDSTPPIDASGEAAGTASLSSLDTPTAAASASDGSARPGDEVVVNASAQPVEAQLEGT